MGRSRLREPSEGDGIRCRAVAPLGHPPASGWEGPGGGRLRDRPWSGPRGRARGSLALLVRDRAAAAGEARARPRPPGLSVNLRRCR